MRVVCQCSDVTIDSTVFFVWTIRDNIRTSSSVFECTSFHALVLIVLAQRVFSSDGVSSSLRSSTVMRGL